MGLFSRASRFSDWGGSRSNGRMSLHVILIFRFQKGAIEARSRLTNVYPAPIRQLEGKMSGVGGTPMSTTQDVPLERPF